VIKMALVVPDVGEVLLLKRALNHTAPDDVKVHLYSNDYTPVEGSVIGSFTESDCAGYAAEELTGASWTVATVTGVTTATYAQLTFNLTGGKTHYGYYVTDNAGTGLLWAERFSDAPHVIPSGGGTEKVTVNLIGE